MKNEKLKMAIVGLLVLMVMMLVSPGWATEEDCQRSHAQCGHDDDGNIDVSNRSDSEARSNSESQSESNANSDAVAEATSRADASGGAGGAGGTGGGATVNTKNESTSLVLTGARDTAGCFTKVTIGAEGFGIGFSRSDSYCKKIRLISRQIALENWDAAVRLECTLKEWREIYGRDKAACWDALYAGPDEEPVSAIASVDSYMLMANVTQEEYEEQQQMIEDKFTQRAHLIDALQNKYVEAEVVIEQLKIEAAKVRAAEQKRIDAEAARRAAARAILEKED